MIDTERLSAASLLPWVRREHAARYAFASQMVTHRVVIDCACGTGIGVRAFLSAGAARVIALDASRAAVSEARHHADDRTVVALANGYQLPVRSGAVEVFISLETIEHIQDDYAFLDEVVRVLAPGGTFVCSTPNRMVKNPGLPASARPLNPFHVREYAESEFRTLLASRFRSVELKGQNPHRAWMVQGVAAMARALSFRAAARAHQAAKARYLVPLLRRHHDVQPLREGREYEFLVAICSEPHRP